MASGFSNGHVPPGLDAPFMKLPEHVDGLVDVQTLVDIQRYLSESEKSDDIVLSTWIKDQYLQEPLTEVGRPIRDTEGFVKLDAAYRRVRQLTGKAQDKWPFFDRNWKKLSSTAVKNVVLGDAAMDANRPVANGAVHHSPMSNGLGGQHDFASYGSELQVPFGTKNATRHQVQSQTLSQPAGTAPISQPKPEQKAKRQAPELSTPDGTVSPADSIQDAGAGKVRGPHGRYVNKSKPPHVATKGPNIKYVKKSKTRAALEGQSDEEPTSSDNEVRAPQVQHLMDPEPGSGSEGIQTNSPETWTASEPTQDVQMANDSPTSSTLAAEAEAVLSNLDRLPPGLVGKKRKSESAVQRGGTKRVRGSRGGVLGRPRKSEPAVAGSPPNADQGTKTEQEPLKSEPIPKVATRRSSRKSVVLAPEPPPSVEPTDGDGPQGVHLQQSDHQTNPDVNGVNITHVDGETIIAKSTGMASLALIDESANGVSQDVEPKISSASQAGRSTSQVPQFQKTPTSTKRKKRVSFPPGPMADKVEIFARISTDTGTQDIPLSKEDIASELNLVERYAAWQNSKSSSVTFEVFKEIAAHLT